MNGLSGITWRGIANDVLEAALGHEHSVFSFSAMLSEKSFIVLQRRIPNETRHFMREKSVVRIDVTAFTGMRKDALPSYARNQSGETAPQADFGTISGINAPGITRN